MTDGCSSPHADCSEVLRELATYLDGELDNLTTEQIAEHLGDCPPCRDTADLEECVREVLRSRCADQAPASLLARLEAVLAPAGD